MMQGGDPGGIGSSFDAGVLRLTIDRAERRNALDDEMVRTLIHHLETSGSDEAVRAILLDATGDHFCSGFDLVGRNADTDAPRPRVGSIQRRLPNLAHRLIPLVLSTQVPVVAAVRGWAAGLGLHLALAADFCVVADDARLWEPFATRGFTPDSGGTWLLPRLVGVARAKDLLMLGREISGREAAIWGMVHASVAPSEVDEQAAVLARRLADGPTVALGLTKWLVHEGAGLDLERHLTNEAFALELSSRSADFREGLQALRDRRDPSFDGH